MGGVYILIPDRVTFKIRETIYWMEQEGLLHLYRSVGGFVPYAPANSRVCYICADQ